MPFSEIALAIAKEVAKETAQAAKKAGLKLAAETLQSGQKDAGWAGDRLARVIPDELGKELTGRLVDLIDTGTFPEEIGEEWSGKELPDEIGEEWMAKELPDEIGEEWAVKELPDEIGEEWTAKELPGEIGEITSMGELPDPDGDVSARKGPDASEQRLVQGDAEKKGLTDAEKAWIKSESGWHDEIVDHIASMEQYEIYKNASLHEGNINGRECLLKDIDFDYLDPKTNKTNRELIEKGRVPIDWKTGEKIELHHMGQDFDGPFAELCENSEHGDGNHWILHEKGSESWRLDPEKKNQYNHERHEYWNTRAQEA